MANFWHVIVFLITYWHVSCYIDLFRDITLYNRYIYMHALKQRWWVYVNFQGNSMIWYENQFCSSISNYLFTKKPHKNNQNKTLNNEWCRYFFYYVWFNSQIFFYPIMWCNLLQSVGGRRKIFNPELTPFSRFTDKMFLKQLFD